MKIESEAFTAREVLGFLSELRERERNLLVRRLRDVGARLQALRPRLLAAESDGSAKAGWNAQEVLAHMAVLSKFYGVIAYRIASGGVPEFDLLSQVRLRDVAGEAAARQPAEDLLDAMAADHERTLRFLESADLADLEKRAETGIGDITLSAADVLRLPLVTHLESHLDQLEQALS